MANDKDRLKAVQAQIKEEYGIDLDDKHIEAVVIETDRILDVARGMAPQVPFDKEPANFPASLARLRDRP